MVKAMYTNFIGTTSNRTSTMSEFTSALVAISGTFSTKKKKDKELQTANESKEIRVKLKGLHN